MCATVIVYTSNDKDYSIHFKKKDNSIFVLSHHLLVSTNKSNDNKGDHNFLNSIPGFNTKGKASYLGKMFPPSGNTRKIQKNIKFTDKDKGGHFYTTEKEGIQWNK